MNFVIKFPTRNRPQKFIQNFLRYQHMRSDLHRVSFVVSMDEDDLTMNTDKIKFFLGQHQNAVYRYGKSKTKIEAINADLDLLPKDFDVLLLASDDMIPVGTNYDDVIYREMREHFPDLDGVLHFNDGRVGEHLNTFCIMGRKYYERFDYIYHPSYVSVFCDNEFTDVSRILNKVKYSNHCLFHHGWVQHVGFDALAQRNENPSNYAVDGANYASRKSRNFDLR